jgi:hypothetical protein
LMPLPPFLGIVALLAAYDRECAGFLNLFGALDMPPDKRRRAASACGGGRRWDGCARSNDWFVTALDISWSGFS